MKAYSEMTIDELIQFIIDKGCACEIEEADHAFAELRARDNKYNAAWRTATCGGCGYYDAGRYYCRKFEGHNDTEMTSDYGAPACPDYVPHEVEK